MFVPCGLNLLLWDSISLYGLVGTITVGVLLAVLFGYTALRFVAEVGLLTFHCVLLP